MKMYFKQSLFHLFDTFDVYDEYEQRLYHVKGKFSLGTLLKIYDADDNEIGTVKEQVFSFLSKYDLYEKSYYLGQLRQNFAFFRKKYQFDYYGWQVEGDFPGWNYHIVDQSGELIAQVRKEFFRVSEHYVLDVPEPENALAVLMFTLAIVVDKQGNTNAAVLSSS